MVSQTVKVINKEGFHMRPANYFIKEMSEFQSTVTLVFNGKPVNGKSIMNIMAACIKFGAELEIQCEGRRTRRVRSGRRRITCIRRKAPVSGAFFLYL